MDKIIVIDCETSGLSPEKNSLLSLGASPLFLDDSINFYKECRMANSKTYNQVALDINGFTLESINNSEKISDSQLYLDFLNWCDQFKEGDNKLILGGHNVGHFDILWLEKIHSSCGVQYSFPFSYRTLDSHSLAYQKFKLSLNMDGIGIQIGFGPEPKPHNALTGALFSKKILNYLL